MLWCEFFPVGEYENNFLNELAIPNWVDWTEVLLF